MSMHIVEEFMMQLCSCLDDKIYSYLKMKKVYFFDFDGVICNSYQECFYIAYRVVFQNSFKNFKIFYHKNHKKILFYNTFVVKGIDFCKIFILLKNKKKIKNLNFQIDNDYKKKFYEERAKFRKENFNKWIKLNLFYKEIVSVFRNNKKKNFFILSNKDFESIKILLKHNKVNIPLKNIYSRELFKSKSQILNKFSKNYQVYFFDDQIENLIKADNDNIKKFLILNKEKKYKNISKIIKKHQISIIYHKTIDQLIK